MGGGASCQSLCSESDAASGLIDRQEMQETQIFGSVQLNKMPAEASAWLKSAQRTPSQTNAPKYLCGELLYKSTWTVS